MEFCGVSEAMMAQIVAWNKRSLTYCIKDDFPTLDKIQIQSAFAEAFGSWSDVCGLSFKEILNPSECDIVVTAGKIDQPLNVLAWSELPDGSDRRLTQKYDTFEKFVIAIQPPANSIDLVAVACHEIGHAIGLEHAQRGTGDLMEPTYAPGRRVPQRGDISRIRNLYGPPTTTPPISPPGVDLPDEMWIKGKSGNFTAKYKLTRLD